MKRWERVRLGEVLVRRKPDVKVEPTGSYDFAGVYSFGRGVFRRETRSGHQFSYSRLSQLRTADFVYPKLMAWEGAFGVVPPSCDGCHVSPEFPVFEPRLDCVVPELLGYYFRIPRVWEEISGKSTGTNVRRRRLHPDDFLSREIPLPPLDEQRRLVDRIDALAAQIEEAKHMRIAVNTELDAMLTAEHRRIAEGAPMRPLSDVVPLKRRPVSVELDENFGPVTPVQN